MHWISNRSPGTALLFLGPICGELVSGHQTLFEFINPLTFILSALPYGFGAIICRECMIRWHKSWPSLVLLGIAFGVYEEFIVARSVWDPEWAELGAIRDHSYWQGVTWTYAAILIHFHLLVSILSSVTLAHLLYPQRRHESWVRDRQLHWCLAGLALWMPVLWVINPYMPSIPALLFSCVAIFGLVYLAWRLPDHPLAAHSGTRTHPRWYGVLAAVNMTTTFGAVFVLPQAEWVPSWPVILGLVLLADMLMVGLILYWSGNGAAWTDLHKLAFISGVLAFFIVFDLLQDLERFGGLSLVAVGSTWALRRLWWSTRDRLNPGILVTNEAPSAHMA